MDCGNGTVTEYDYDPLTFRLRVMRTTRPGYLPRFPVRRAELSDARVLQHLHYTYDPSGNITDIHDDAWSPAFFNNQLVESASRFTYDAAYRLIEATGRENGAAAGAPTQLNGPSGDASVLPITAAGALRSYIQRYRYDRVGNIDEMRHFAPGGSPAEPPGWTRRYRYSLSSNRMLETWFGRVDDPRNGSGNVNYDYDTHGSMLNLNGADDRFDMRWDWNDMIHTIWLGGGGRVWYQYGADKQRCRKLLVHDPAIKGTVKEERIYLGGYELYRRYTNDRSDPVEEIESHHLFGGEQRVLLVDDVLRVRDPRPDGLAVREQTLWRYQYGNHLGSVGVELDHTSQVISYEEYHPYGTSAFRLMNSNAKAPAKRYRFTGLERDEESGLTYHSARFYCPTMVRWISCDPLDASATLNTFSYAESCPTGQIDKNGLAARPPDAEEIEKAMKYFEAKFRQNPIPTLADWRATWERPVDNRLVLGLLPDGTGYVGTQSNFEREKAIISEKTYVERSLRTGANIAGGPYGALAYGAFGDAGSDWGAFVDVMSGAYSRHPLNDQAPVSPSVVWGPSGALALREDNQLPKLRSNGNGNGAGGPIVKAAEGGGFANIPGQETRVANPIDDAGPIERYLMAKRAGVEVGQVVMRDGTAKERPKNSSDGHPTHVDLPAGPNVASTEHAHQESGVALFSVGPGKDVENFKGQFAPDATHVVTGERWPDTRAVAAEIGVDPPPLVVMITTVKQWMIDAYKHLNGAQ
jgi:RHS repeat-associated protein